MLGSGENLKNLYLLLFNGFYVGETVPQAIIQLSPRTQAKSGVAGLHSKPGQEWSFLQLCETFHRIELTSEAA
jgi:hypothetical protein